MPFGISDTQPDCDGWATVKQEPDGSYATIGCHAVKQDAIDQMVAASVSEDIEPIGEVSLRALPDNYRPALSEDVPTGRACGNCVFYNEDNIEGEGDNLKAYCEKWAEYVDGGFYCNSWQPREELTQRAEVNLDAPEFMRASARRGLRLHEEGLSGDGLMPQTVADARRMASGEISESKWRKIGAWIARHISDLDAIEGDEITAGLVAMLLWGGGSTRTSARRTQEYANRMVAQLDSRSTSNDGKADSGLLMYDVLDMEATADTIHWVSDSQDEKRSVAYTNLGLREVGDGNTFVGYASVFDSPSEPMPFIEYVRKGAFAKTLNDGADVRFLIDHDGVPLARTKSGTLSLVEDDRGLRVEASLDPMNPDAQRVISAMRRGDLSQMSFAFRTIKDSWNSDYSVRELKEVQLYDVSVVTYPAYEDTVAELRRAQHDTVVVTSPVLLRQRQLQIARHR
jgi:HK97 family phage prohead protease